MTAPIIRLHNVKQIYSGRTVLKVDDLAIYPGTITGLAGPNGSGKSTLLRMIAFIEPPSEGDITYLGQPTGNKPGEVHRQVTLLVQEPYLLKRTVRHNVAFGLKCRGETNIAPRIEQALRAVGLDPDEFASRQWFELSGGENQRVALAARLALNPKVLLMDEPTASLDTRSGQRIREAALAARKEYGTSLVIASHDMDWLQTVSDQIIYLEKGRITSVQ